MTYVAVKGGERAIANAERSLAAWRRGEHDVDELATAQLAQQLRFAVDRIMAEGGLYDREVAALALKQAAGDVVEAVFLVRAYRTTLPRLYASRPLDTTAMDPIRRISAIFKDVPGGQIIGPSFDYTHRLLDAALAHPNGAVPPPPQSDGTSGPIPRALDALVREGLVPERTSSDESPDGDVTAEPVQLPASRAVRLQMLARADEGWLLGLAYSTQRGYGRNHPFAGEIRAGEVEIEVVDDELGFVVTIGAIFVTEVQMVNQFAGSEEQPPQFTRGYGLVFGYCERKAMAMALVDRALQGRELGERLDAPAQDEEFVLLHGDNVEAQGFVQHLKLPHYVDFQAELGLVRRLRAERAT